ncbi:tetratricopeptide repeat-containing protein [Nitrosomonas communis]|uniref:DUF4071 domain-containing protein n=1 Tax=Nitrosomonas communis TaxID=44574 RepID=A0A1I4L3E1_9PROT|nr:tetratricopeptide repeat-containing protein [Nitrosomonas communis]SFL85396.1 hypothetical protein SAMN05421863_1005129 [Nitrosomonas communis]
MPFGQKATTGGKMIDFDAVYHDLIELATLASNLVPIRADEKMTGGIIHKPMFERLILCEYAIADLTTANANVFYELGLRHAVRPFSTVLLFAKSTGQLPFDVAPPLRSIRYGIGANGKSDNVAAIAPILTDRFKEAHKYMTDSPVYQVVEGFPEIQRLKTDVFRERAIYSEQIKKQLAEARKQGLDAVRTLEHSLGTIADTESGVGIDLFPSYRAGRGEEAEKILLELTNKRGSSSETYGILLGRVYKDRWEAPLPEQAKPCAPKACSRKPSTLI